MARERSERVALFKGWWGEEMGSVGMGAGGGLGNRIDVGVGGRVGGGGRAGIEDPGRQLIGTIDDIEEQDSGDDDDGSSSDSE